MNNLYFQATPVLGQPCVSSWLLKQSRSFAVLSLLRTQGYRSAEGVAGAASAIKGALLSLQSDTTDRYGPCRRSVPHTDSYGDRRQAAASKTGRVLEGSKNVHGVEASQQFATPKQANKTEASKRHDFWCILFDTLFLFPGICLHFL